MTLSLPHVDCLPPPALRQRALGQFDTPPDVAADLVSLVAVNGARVVEPSAGEGNVVAALLDAGADFVHCVELDPSRVIRLRQRFSRAKIEVVEADWLTFVVPGEWPWLVVGNPPYDQGSDTAHVAKMLDHFETLALLLRTVFIHGQERRERIWSRARLMAWEPYGRRIAFGEEAGMIDVSLFLLKRDDAPPDQHEPAVRLR